MKFAFVHAEKDNHSICALCRVLGVTRQGYYQYTKRGPSRRQQADEELQRDVKRIHDASRRTYGGPRVGAQLAREGKPAGKRRVARAMRSQGLCARARRSFRRTTKADPRHPKAENVLARDFTATRPNERWVTDITYIWTMEGWCYLAAILDLYSRAVVGWALEATLATSLPLKALDNALLKRTPGESLLHHSDRGCQYTSDDYRKKLDSVNIDVSMSRVGNCWDNAVAESFFATLKTELTEGRIWSGRAELRAAVFDYIEVFYNRQRLHSTLGYRTPAEVASSYAATAA
jgi:putative transposase